MLPPPPLPPPHPAPTPAATPPLTSLPPPPLPQIGTVHSSLSGSCAEDRLSATRGGLSFQDALTQLSVYLAAIIHDYDHRGLTNAFLIRDGDPLAVSEPQAGHACTHYKGHMRSHIACIRTLHAFTH